MENNKQAQIKEAKGLAKLFQIELTIKLFGVVIVHWIYPPQNKKGEEYV